LTPRRIGSLSTKTTHPHYIQMVQSLFNDIEFNINVVNPYQFRTKGEMLKECKDQELLKKIIPESVSCSNWKRKGKQCGRCIPCLIRRAALSKAGIQESNSYLYNDLNAVLKDQKNRDDLFAIITAVSKVNDKTITSWLLDSGPLSHDEKARTQYKEIFMKGLSEVKDYLIKIGVIQ
ncbi:MAG: 7-cyano-7-deazaguanine synthase, partial [Candidatus Omnitrophica bacterium]|nr:7-cyano-7-deazaguanine synthase [Candidatus Omnitrophota bacterium]